MSAQTSSPSRLRLHPTTASAASRNSIISSSAKGWSPLQISKRDSITSPTKLSPNPAYSPEPDTPADRSSPRRTSSSFKHLTKNSLVANSPFKSPTTIQGAQAAGLSVDFSGKDNVIHERRSVGGFVPARSLGIAPAPATGVAATPKAAIGLGITATRPRNLSGGAAVAGTRKVSKEKGKVAFPAVNGERKSSSERKVSGSKENDSPDVRYAKRTPKQSGGLKGLAKAGHVSKSPFMEHVEKQRTPSGSFGVSSTRTNESPNLSPRTIPAEKDDIFSSPSPRRTSGGRPNRRDSPAGLHPGARASDSPTPSPPRLSISPAPPSAGPSPLSQATLGAPSRSRDKTTPTPTPKSAITPSRRLRGPRNGGGSPTRQAKTVTFQSTADVREFERMSIEGSFDGSFEVEELDCEEWIEEEVGAREDSLEQLLNDTTLPLDNSRDSTVEHQDPDSESATADFVHTLIEEGLFSPPEMATPAFGEQSAFDLPEHSTAPFLTTPSLGSSIHGTPLMGDMDKMHQAPAVQMPEHDQDGIPYGRTHHAERAALAHSLPPLSLEISPLAQPDLPHERDHQMLYNADVSEPAIPHAPYPQAKQDGPMPDPFITVQTTTKMMGMAEDRQEDGMPLGRTSHHDRSNAARALATRGLGLGMPRSPAVVGLKEVKGAEISLNDEDADYSMTQIREQEDMISEDGSEEEEGDAIQHETLFDASLELGPVVDAPPTGQRKVSEVPEMVGPSSRMKQWRNSKQLEETPKRGLPKPPPRAEPVGLPSPVTSPVREAEPELVEKRSSKFDMSIPFSLPSIISSSPFFSTTAATFDDTALVPTSKGSSSPESDVDRPLTPPPHRTAPAPREDSPHRIPDFDFDNISLHVVEKASPPRTPTKINPSDSLSPTRTNASPFKSRSVESRLSESTSHTSILSADFGSSTGIGGGSTTTRVRQRISRELVRETVEKRIAEGSLNRKTSNLEGLENATSRLSISENLHQPPSTSTSLNTSRDQAVQEKDLPPPPAEESASVDMTKAATTDATPLRKEGERPKIRPRSQTLSAQEALKSFVKEGGMEEPRSALDKLMLGITDEQPQIKSILQKPAPTLLPPVDVASRIRTPTPNAMEVREQAIIAKRREKEGRSASGQSKAGRRRSVSVGEVETNQNRFSIIGNKNPRLTLGIKDDQMSMLDEFTEEIGNIGHERGYKIREKPAVQARSDHKVSHSKGGDIDAGRAWRQLRRPSDMYEHAAEIRAMKSNPSNSGKAFGTIFVKVLGIEGLAIPVPDQQTFFCVTLDNGIDYIRTPYSVLGDGAKVNQEFSLVEHPNFEFSLSLDIRRDPHVLKAIHEKQNPAAIPPQSPVKSKGGFRALFNSPSKNKPGRDSRSSTPMPPPTPTDTIAKYFATPTSSTIAKTHVSFKPIAKNCDAKVLEIRYPMFAMFKGEPDRSPPNLVSNGPPQAARKQVAKITLQIFRLPAIPGLKQEDLPQSIDDCLRGMRHHAWHEHEYHEGILTQEGGDCTHPKRRMFKLIGGNLVAVNEVTKKEVASISLRQALSVMDLNTAQLGTPTSRMTSRHRSSDEGITTRPKSFMIAFKDGEEIIFAADKDAEKAVWMETLEGLIGKIPTNPLWAELLAIKQRQPKARSVSSTSLMKDSGRSASRATQKERPKSAVATKTK